MKFWCGSAFMETSELVHLVPLLDEAGYHGMMVSDHLLYPKDLRSRYPYAPGDDGQPLWGPETQWPDAWVLIGAMAAVTANLHFTTNVYIPAHRQLIQLAKEIATAAVISDGRVALGVGAGWMEEEFRLQGVDFRSRGRRLDEMMPALRALWQGGWVQWHGTFYDVPELMLEPHPPSPVPIYVGGQSDAALRRAAHLGDGWIGMAYEWDEAALHIGRLRRFLAEAGRSHDDFEIICALLAPPDADLYRRAEDELGITGMMVMPWWGAPAPERRGRVAVAAAYKAAIDEFAETIVARCR